MSEVLHCEGCGDEIERRGPGRKPRFCQDCIYQRSNLRRAEKRANLPPEEKAALLKHEAELRKKRKEESRSGMSQVRHENHPTWGGERSPANQFEKEREDGENLEGGVEATEAEEAVRGQGQVDGQDHPGGG